MSDIKEVKNAEELLEETMKVLSDKKITEKALAEKTKYVIDNTGADKASWKQVVKAFSNKGKAWIAGPLELDPTAKHKDAISPIFIKLLSLIQATEIFDQTDEILGDYLDALKNQGIEIKINHDMFNHCDTSSLDEPIEEYLKTSKAYSSTIEEYSDEIKDEHSVKAEELNFAPQNAYAKVVNIYKKGLNGKEIDDDVQDILTYNEMLDTAVNLVAEYARSKA